MTTSSTPRTTPSRIRLGRIALTALVGLSLTVSGCSTLSGRDDPSETAGALANGLTSGDLGDVTFSGNDAKRAQRVWKDITEKLNQKDLEVRAGDVEEGEDDTATVPLRYSWRLGDQTWKYRTTAKLDWNQDAWEVRFHPSMLVDGLKNGETVELQRASASRGDIFGADQQRLVTSRSVEQLGIDKTKVDTDQQEDSARSLAKLLDIDADAFVDKVGAASEQAFVEAIVLRVEDVTPEIRRGYPEIEGAVALEDEMDLAPYREFALPILGTIGPVTAEIMEENPGVYQVGDEVGLSGLQQRYDERLRGNAGVVVRATSDDSSNGEDGDSGEGDSDQDRVLFRAKPGDGKRLGVTLDRDLQTSAEQILADEVGAKSASALVAIRPSDGHVLAAADGPGTGGIAASTVGQYPPGSTFKVVTTLALLRSGVSPSTTLPCPTTTTVDGKNFENYDDYPSDANGDIELRTAFANSCNTAFILQRSDATPAALADAAASLGLGVDHDLGAPAYLGSVPKSGSPTGKAAATIGQGEVLASPLAMATVAASVAKGETVVPQLMAKPQPKDAGSAKPKNPLTSDEADQLKSLMRGVVTEGSGSFLSDIPGDDVLAKTGTAEFERDGKLQTHAWMIAAQGDLAVAAFVELGESGSATAGPLVEQLLRTAAQ